MIGVRVVIRDLVVRDPRAAYAVAAAVARRAGIHTEDVLEDVFAGVRSLNASNKYRGLGVG